MGKTLDTLLVLTGTAILATSAFSRRTREAIHQRASNRSEISGSDKYPLECSHYNHSRESIFYDDKDNGVLVTLPEHFAIHERARGRADEIGLDERSNDFAVRSIWGRIWDFATRRGIERTEVLGDIDDAREAIGTPPSEWYSLGNPSEYDSSD